MVERFQKQDSYLESQIAIGWKGEKCRHMDQLAEEDKSYAVTRKERSICENEWNFTVNVQGPVSPMDKREDYLEDMKAIKNLRHQDAQPSNPPILPTYQTRQRPFRECHQER